MLSVTVVIVHYHCHTIRHTSDAPEASSGMQLDPLGITLHRAIVVVVEDVLRKSWCLAGKTYRLLSGRGGVIFPRFSPL